MRRCPVSHTCDKRCAIRTVFIVLPFSRRAAASPGIAENGARSWSACLSTGTTPPRPGQRVETVYRGIARVHHALVDYEAAARDSDNFVFLANLGAFLARIDFSGGLAPFDRDTCMHVRYVYTHTCTLVVCRRHQKRLATGYASGFHGNLFRDRDLSGIVRTNLYHLHFLKKKIARKM